METICERIACGESLTHICREEGMPARRTVFYWLLRHPEAKRKYDEAWEQQYRWLESEAKEIADDRDIDPRQAKNMINVRLFMISKRWPDRFGERVKIEKIDSPAAELTDDELARIAGGRGS